MGFDDKKTPRFDKKRFDSAIKHLHKSGNFVPQMLSDKSVFSLIKETRNILNYSLSVKMPEVMSNKLRNDLFVFSGCKTFIELKEASLLLTDSAGNLKPFNVFKRDVESIYSKYNERYLRAEYEFAVSSAEAAAQWSEIDPEDDRYNLQYRTASDEKVRNEHAILNGITLSASDSFWDSNYPPNGYGCRCQVVKVLRDKYPRTDSDEAEKAGKKATTILDKKGKNRAEMFRFNPGKQQVIFPQNHPYYRVKEQISSVLSGLRNERTIANSKAKFDAYDEKQWNKTYFSADNGGFVVTEKERIVSANKSKNEMAKYIKERDMSIVYAENGYKIEHLSEIPRISSPDVKINGKYADLKRTKSHNNIVRHAKKATTEQGAELVLFQFEERTADLHNELNKLTKEGVKGMYFITGENIVYTF